MTEVHFTHGGSLQQRIEAMQQELKRKPWGTITKFRFLDNEWHSVTYDTDDELDDYAVIGYDLPANIYVELEDDTYGEMQGLRIYR